MGFMKPELHRWQGYLRQHWQLSALTAVCVLTLPPLIILLSGSSSSARSVSTIAKISSKSTVSAGAVNGTNTSANSNASGQTTGNTNGSKSSSSTNTSGHDTNTNSAPLNKLALIATPSSLMLNEFGTGNITVTSNFGNTPAIPQLSFNSSLYAYVDMSDLAPKWTIVVRQTNFSTGGQATLAITSGNLTVQVPVTWRPVPFFSSTKGTFDRTDGTNTITYTANFSITPSVGFLSYGNPHIRTWISFGGGACINTSQLDITVPYSGQNNFSISCVVNKVASSTAGKLDINVSVDAVLPDGNSMSHSPQTLGFQSTQSPYNQ